MKAFQEPEAKIHVFALVDILTASSTDPTTEEATTAPTGGVELPIDPL